MNGTELEKARPRADVHMILDKVNIYPVRINLTPRATVGVLTLKMDMVVP
jgi:hypothetical protein